MMRNIEGLIYDLLKDRPVVKDAMKFIYQGIFSYFGIRRQYGLDWLTVRERSFFGFHDKNPWSWDNEFLLAHRFIGWGNELESAKRRLQIAIFRGENWLEPLPITETRAWNWQQGAQLQWVGQKKRILFNDFVDGRCVAREVDLNGNEQFVYEYPVVAANRDGNMFAAICFYAFGNEMPGYGYDFKGAQAKSIVPRDKLIVFDKKSVEQIIDGRAIPRLSQMKIEDERSFISHVAFNEGGAKIAFLRRNKRPGRRLLSALYILNRKSGEIKRMPFRNMVSHYCWIGDRNILAYANDEDGQGFFIADVESGTLETVSKELGSVDGHPHSDRLGKRILVDAYPDKFRLQRLSVWDWDTKKRLDLALLFSPMRFWGRFRVDLHPRIRADGAYACIDCSINGMRSLATIPLKTI